MSREEKQSVAGNTVEMLELIESHGFAQHLGFNLIRHFHIPRGVIASVVDDNILQSVHYYVKMEMMKKENLFEMCLQCLHRVTSIRKNGEQHPWTCKGRKKTVAQLCIHN